MPRAGVPNTFQALPTATVSRAGITYQSWPPKPRPGSARRRGEALADDEQAIDVAVNADACVAVDGIERPTQRLEVHAKSGSPL